MKPLQRLVAVIFILIFLMLGVILLYANVPAFARVLDAGVKRLTNEQTEDDDDSVTRGTAIVSSDPGILYAGENPDDTMGDQSEKPSDGSLGSDISKLADIMETGASSEIDLPAMTEAIYIAPSEDDLEVPETLIERTGLLLVTPETETVSDDEAERLKAELDSAPEGDGLDFDPLYYPYYSMLDETEQHLYRQIYAHADALLDSFTPVEPYASELQLKNAFTAVFCDHPELFWLNTAYGVTFDGGGEALAAELYFNNTAGNIDSAKSTFSEAADVLLEASNSAAGLYDKELLVHDAIADKDLYSLAAPMNQSAYSSVVNGSTVCAGYSRAFQYLMQQLNVPCYYCYGYAGENHAWNIIKLDDDYYNVDVTWDDTDDSRGRVYTWFNRTDADYGRTHIRKDLAVNLPPCNGTTYKGPEDDEVPQTITAETPVDTGTSDAPVQVEMQTQRSTIPVPSQSFTTDEPDEPGTAASTAAASNEISDWSGVITDLASYYEACYDSIMERGTGSYSFDLTVSDENLIRQISAAYRGNYTKSGFMQKAMEDSGAVHCHVRATVTEQDDGTFIVTHSVNMY